MAIPWKFDDSGLEGNKTVIITNVKANSDGNVLIQKVGNFHDHGGNGGSISSSDLDTDFHGEHLVEILRCQECYSGNRNRFRTILSRN